MFPSPLRNSSPPPSTGSQRSEASHLTTPEHENEKAASCLKTLGVSQGREENIMFQIKDMIIG